MLLEKETDVVKHLGPFERAQTNLDKFVWNFMILYTTATLVKTLQSLEDDQSKKADTTRMSVNLTLRGVFELILDKNNGVWD